MISSWTKHTVNGLTNIPSLQDIIEKGGAIEDERGLFLKLQFTSGTKLIKFGFPRLMRVMDRNIQLQNLDDKSWLFTSEKSDLMEWFNEENYGTYEGVCQHFIIITQEKIIDIFSDEHLSESYPKIIST